MTVMLHDNGSITQLLYNTAKQKFHKKAYTYSMQQLPYYDPLSCYTLDVFKHKIAPDEWSPLYMLVSQ